jgi:hypothetical protein
MMAKKYSGILTYLLGEKCSDKKQGVTVNQYIIADTDCVTIKNGVKTHEFGLQKNRSLFLKQTIKIFVLTRKTNAMLVKWRTFSYFKKRL